MVPFYNACDVVILTSRHEGTPNVLLEAMACGRPVVATRVADNGLIVPDGRGGHVVDLDHDDDMVTHVAHLLDNGDARADMGRAARAWVEERFSLAAMVERTATIYRQTHAHKVGRHA